MKNSWHKLVPFFLVLTFVTKCVEPYNPPDVSSPNILVIDGSMNIVGSSTIRLTRTQMLADQNPVKEELGANVSFEEEEGPSYLLSENGKGIYSLPQQAFNIQKNHRIVVQTTDGKEYVSEFVPVIKSSKIDSVNWVVTPDMGVQLYVNTHDLEHGVRYYLWTYEETWRYVAAFYSRYEWVNRVPTPRVSNIYVCYNTKPSKNILIGSTARLSEPVIHNFPLFISRRTQKRSGLNTAL